jgi:hypothetical protein
MHYDCYLKETRIEKIIIIIKSIDSIEDSNGISSGTFYLFSFSTQLQTFP